MTTRPLPNLEALTEDELIALTTLQLSKLSTVAPGSVPRSLRQYGLQPAVSGSNVYRAGAVKRFCEYQRRQTLARIEASKQA